MSTMIELCSGRVRETSMEEGEVQRRLNAGSVFVAFPGLSEEHSSFTVRASAVVFTSPTRTMEAL